MIIKNIKIFSQNVYKNRLLTNTILKAQKEFDIIFIQELPWSYIWSIPSLSNKEGEKLVRIPNYSNWITFSRNASSNHNFLRVILYINIRLSQLCFSLWKDIFNYRDISCISLLNSNYIYFLVNIYSDSSQTALKYLKNTEANINNILVVARNFNIRDNSWDSSFLYHSIYCNLLTNITDSMNLCVSKSTNQVSTRYSDNQSNSDLVINLMFLEPNSSEFDNHMWSTQNGDFH